MALHRLKQSDTDPQLRFTLPRGALIGVRPLHLAEKTYIDYEYDDRELDKNCDSDLGGTASIVQMRAVARASCNASVPCCC
eukprot:6193723-Pleurochrysis_carterae.AAC.1